MYAPQTLVAADVPQLQQRVQAELESISRSMASPADYAALRTLYAEPKRVFEGMIVKADGTTWDPGSGAGVYAYIGSAWVSLSASGSGTFGFTSVVQTAATLNVTATDGIYAALCNCTSNNITVNLPTAAGNTATLMIKKTDSSTNTVTVDGNGAQTIDGGTTAVLAVQYESITLVSDGSNWSIV